jgi:uncharacterized membrane protein YdjX (TVP38/TMEM64 family)
VARLRASLPLIRLLVLAAGLFALAAIFVPHSPATVRSEIAGIGWPAPAALALLWIVLTPALFSGTILATAAGMLFGAWIGTLVGLVGATLGGLLSFAIARANRCRAPDRLASPRLARVYDRINRQPFRAILLLRVMPGVPATWLNYAAGLTRIPPRVFVAAIALGAVPRVFMYAALGGSVTHSDVALRVTSVCLFVLLGAVGAVTAVRTYRAARPAAG